MKDGVEVSVYMIVHNGSRFIRAAVDSILAQSFPDFEFVVVDDGSTDETADILNSYRDGRLRVVHQPHCGGPRASNRALAECKGDLIARIDADDIALPDRIARQVEFLRRNPDVGMVSSNYLHIDENEEPLWEVRLPESHSDLLRQLWLRNRILHSATMIRRSVVEAVGNYDEILRFAQDYDFWLRIASRFKLANLPQILAKKRLHGGATRLSSNRQNMQCFLLVRRRAAEMYGLGWIYRIRLLKYHLLPVSPPPLLSMLLRMQWWFKKLLYRFRLVCGGVRGKGIHA